MNDEVAEKCRKCHKPLEREPKINPATPRVAPPPGPGPNEFIYLPTPSGARPMKLIVENLGLEIDVPLNRESVLLGREDPENNVHPDIDTTTFGGNLEGVSRKHARIILKGNQYFVEDLNSMNNTYVNKIKVAANQLFPLNHEDVLALGRLNLKVHLL
jgi:hypothetical protein